MCIYSKGYKDTDVYKIWNGMTIMLRFITGYRSIVIIPAEEYENVRKVMFNLFNMIPKKGDLKL